MNASDWVTVVVSLLGFGAVVYQIRQVTHGLRASARASIYDLGARVKEMQIERPELHRWMFRDDGKPASEDDQDRLRVMVDYQCLYLEKIATHRRLIAKANRQAWCQYVRDIYQSSPVVHAHLDERWDHYSQELREIVSGAPTQGRRTFGMTRSTRNIVWGICVLLTLGALVAWLATGARGWTRYPSENLQQVQADSEEGLGDLFAETGLEDESGSLETIDNEFRFGLLPSGPGRDAISVASVAGPCVAIALLAWWLERRKKPAPPTE